VSFIYYRDGATTGTATGDGGLYATEQDLSSGWTSAFTTTAEYYASEEAALAATSFAAGDTLISTSDHDHDYNSSGTKTLTAASSGAFTKFQSVSATDGSYEAGSLERNDITGGDISWIGRRKHQGVRYGSDDNLVIGGGSGGDKAQLYFRDSILFLNGNSDQLAVSSADGCSIKLVDSDISFGGNTAFISLRAGGNLEWIGGAVIGAATAVTWLFDNGLNGAATAGGMTAYLEGVDLSKVAGILGGVGSSEANEDIISVTLYRCALGTVGTTRVEESLTNLDHFFKMTQCFDASTGADIQDFESSYFGTVEQDLSIFRQESPDFPSGDQGSYEMISSANTDATTPLTYQLSRFAALSNTASDEFEVYITSDTALTDTDFWVEVIYPDGTNKHISNFVSSQNADVFAAGTTLTTDSSSTWTLGKSNKYVISIPTSGDEGADGSVKIIINLGKASTTIYLASSAGVK